jgi:hypothetical protein
MIEYVPTKHARKRWQERVNPNVDESIIDQEIVAALNRADYIWADSEGNHHYVDKDELIQYVCNPVNHKIITIVRIDYGFPEDLNHTITKDLIDRVRQKIEVLAVIEENQQKQRDKNATAKARLQNQIDELEAKINAIEAKEKEIEAIEARMDADLASEKKEYDSLAYSLVWSIAYRTDKLATGGAA